jgi:DNA-binding FrmR family transcriptional regulator
MIDDDRYCDDILIQLSAVNKAIESLENTILESHIKTCVNRELKSGNDEIINEVMELFKRLR